MSVGFLRPTGTEKAQQIAYSNALKVVMSIYAC